MQQAAIEFDTIGRFEIIKTLGEGAQGVVYLAHDPHLGRNVAIKSLVADDAAIKLELADSMMAEARMLCKFQHPNIVSIYEANEDNGRPYMVLEYVPGDTLGEHLKKHGPLAIDNAIALMMSILDGLSYCHRNQIVHSDIKPANIVITAEQVPKLMDFGISRVVSGNTQQSDAILGTPRYLAPEYISRRELTAASDMFAIGLIFYEMLTGAKAIKGRTVDAILHAITSENILKPSSLNTSIEPELEAILLKALEKTPTERYPNATAMHNALEAYTSPDNGDDLASDPTKQNSTVEFMLRRIRNKGDFPTLSASFVSLNSLFAQENQNAKTISAVILRDFALTNKILRIVNSASHARRGGKITTISRAVVTLGFGAIRDIAASLILVDQLANKSQAEQLQNEIISSLYSGIFAKQFAPNIGAENVEETFICAMFHRLGSLLTTFYLHDESEEIQQQIARTQGDPEVVSRQVLGASFSELGKIIAEDWGFPNVILDSMTPFADVREQESALSVNQLGVVASLANEVSDIIADSNTTDPQTEFRSLSMKYSSHLEFDGDQISAAIQQSNEEFSDITKILRINTKASKFSAQVIEWDKKEEEQKIDENLDETAISIDTDVFDEADTPSESTPEDLLKSGLSDVATMIENQSSIDDTIQTILETIYLGLRFNRVIFSLASPKKGLMQAKFGYGDDIENALNHFSFPLEYEQDIFHLSLARGTDIFVNDLSRGKIKNGLPAWYRKLIQSQAFFLLPLLVSKRPVGLIYADYNIAQASVIPDSQIKLLKSLRDQAVSAFSKRKPTRNS